MHNQRENHEVENNDFCGKEKGAGLAEYALLLLLVALACILALTTLGTTLSGTYNTITGIF